MKRSKAPRICRGLVLVLAGAAVASCTSGPGALPGAVSCATQYRPDAETSEGWRSPELLVELNSQRSETFEVMTLEVSYTGDQPDGNAVTVRVTDATEETIFSAVYQHDGTDAQLATTWAGGTSFTGLLTMHHEGASLQVMCSA
ncbi:MAG TPA: hypothetical protein VK024_05800 [Actinomycetaceae bacterium]|nr:hypothetical protein [Actinomycetaceae bacterium]